MSSALTGCFLAAKPDLPLEAAAEALAAFGVAAEDAAVGAQGPGTFHARLYDALYALDPAELDGRTRIEEL
jgi:hydroxyethylthiazole kinase